jgi:lysophospholipase L1-like esterase
MLRLIVGAVAAGAIVIADVAVAGGFWLPPDFNSNNPNLAVAVGDSITLGTLSDGNGTAAQPYPAVLQSLLAPAHPGFVVKNRGVGGETTSEGLDRLAGVLAADRPGFVLIMEGTNDATFHESPDDIVQNLRAMVQLAKAHFSIPILGTIVPNHRSTASDARARISQVNAMLPALAAQEGVRLVNTFAPMTDRGLFGADALHPTPEGYQVLGAAWHPAVSAAIIESRLLLGGVTVAAGRLDSTDNLAEILTGPGAGGGPHVKTFAGDGAQLGTGFMAYDPGFIGGVRVATCDFNGDGVDDLLLGPGPGGGPHVRLLAGSTGESLAEFLAYDPAFTGGVFVACGPVEAPGARNIVTGAGRGGSPHLRILRYQPGAPGGVVPVFEFLPYDAAFLGGVQVAVGDVTGDGRAEVITGPGPGGGPHVRVLTFDSGALTPIGEFFAYDPAFTSGVFVATGDVTGGGAAKVITGPGRGGGPHVRVLNLNGSSFFDFLAYDPAFTGGVFVGAGDLDGDTKAEVITGAGPGAAPHVRGFAVPGGPTGPGFLAY